MGEEILLLKGVWENNRSRLVGLDAVPLGPLPAGPGHGRPGRRRPGLRAGTG